MSYSHKDFVQRESKNVLQGNGWETFDGHIWTRVEPKPLAEIFEQLPEAKDTFVKTFLKGITRFLKWEK